MGQSTSQESCFFGPENSTGASDDPSMAVRLCRELVDTDDSGKKMRCHVISCHVHGDCEINAVKESDYLQ